MKKLQNHFSTLLAMLLPALLLSLPASDLAADPFAKLRAEMVEEISADVRDTAEYVGRKKLTDQVLRVMAETPRHEFVPQEMRPLAYKNRPLPIGYGQTISQPYIVALMTELLEPRPEHKVLEIGTGSGYQAAVLAALIKQVYTIEIIEELGQVAEKRFRELQLDTITSRIGDGYFGWPEEAPFDAIVVTAAADHIPPPLIKQLKPGGRMVIPVGGRFQVQQLVLVEKTSEDKMITHQILPVRFVPLTRSD
jgi:protein-L-isoaspartate(D-aspartate) O-methyltransferase